LGSLVACGAAAPPKPDAPRPTPADTSHADAADVSAALGDSKRFKVDGDKRPCVGPSNAVVTVVEFEDFECPFTRRVEAVVQKLLAAHPTDMRICFRHFPITRDHPNAMLAAHAAEELFVEKGAQAFYELRADLLREDLSREKVTLLAQKHGANPAELAAALSEGRHAAAVKQDEALLQQMGFNGTPHFFINGREIAGAKRYEEFAEVVDDEMRRGRELLGRGTPPEALFSTIMQHSLDKADRPKARPGEPKRVRIRFINVCYDGEGAVPQSRSHDEALKLATRLRNEIAGGADFAQLAKQYSNASNAQVGGEFGWLSRGTLIPEIDSAALALAVGETSQVIDAKRCAVLVQRLE
jgi:protein-disulfide isomerase